MGNGESGSSALLNRLDGGRRPASLALALALILTAPGVAHAQSAADKATARDLAAEGIKALQAGDAQKAVKNLEKAQALYDAPIHLLYLGRAHTAVGNLVEAAEAYRSLVRAQLGPDAPAVFRNAQEEARPELEKLEPRLAKLTIEVEPEAEGLKVTVDGKVINVAALGVPRATNPGKRTVRVEAPGYETVEAEVELSEGGSETVSMSLKEGESVVEEPAVGGAVSTASEDSSQVPAPADEVPVQSADMGLFAGFRLGGAMAAGEIEEGVAASDYFQPGFGGEAALGFRFLKHLGIKGYFGYGQLSPGSELNDFAERQRSNIVAKNTGERMDAGVALLAMMDPRHLGAYGELGFSFLHQYQWKQEFSGANCEMSAKYSGWAIRGGGGMNVPLHKYVNLVPSVDVSLGQFGQPTEQSTCAPRPIDAPVAASFVEGVDRFDDDFAKSMHFQIFLGAGFDFHFLDLD